MLLMTTIRTRGGRRSLPIDGTGQVLLGHAEFERVLMQERERSDRNSHGFAVVLFDIRSLDDGEFARVMAALARRCRKVDILGWHDWGHVGVILTDAREEGACRFLEDVGPDLLEAGSRPPRARLFVYGWDHSPHGPAPEPSPA